MFGRANSKFVGFKPQFYSFVPSSGFLQTARPSRNETRPDAPAIAVSKGSWSEALSLNRIMSLEGCAASADDHGGGKKEIVR
jgi:hypothetical protein